MHQQNSRPQHRDDLVDLGNTPPHFAPVSILPESSLRSTLCIEDEAAQRTDSDVRRDGAVPRYIHQDIPGDDRENGDADAEQLRQRSVAPPLEYVAMPFTPINLVRPVEAQQTPMRMLESSVSRFLPTTSSSFTLQHNRRIPELKIDFYELDRHEVDAFKKEVDDDRVYHFGHEKGEAYSGRFVDNGPLDPETAMLVEQKLNQRRVALRVAAGAQKEQETRARLEAGSSLILEQTSSSPTAEDRVLCHLPGCLSPSDSIPPSTYYFSFLPESIGQLQAFEKPCFCLKCFEWLWTGGYTQEELPHPGIVLARAPSRSRLTPDDFERGEPVSPLTPGIEASLQKYQFDGSRDSQAAVKYTLASQMPESSPLEDVPLPTSPRYVQIGGTQSLGYAHPTCEADPAPGNSSEYVMDPVLDGLASLFESRHAAPTAEDAECSSSPRSVNSEGEWMFPPTRLQHIAYAIFPGASVHSKHASAVFLWKAASREQLRWEQHLRKTRETRAYYFDSSDGEDSSYDLPNFKIEDDDFEDADVECWELVTGLRKKHCHGNDLSEILYQASKTHNL